MIDEGRARSIDATRTGYPDHVKVGEEIVNAQNDLMEAVGGPARARQVADLFSRSSAADPQLSKLLHSSFDMDRVDYLQRDSRAAGVPYGNIDVNYLMNSLRISRTGMLGVAEKALPAAEQFLLARFFMHKAVYFHKTTFGIEEACRQLLRRIRDAGLFDIPPDGQAVLALVRSPELVGFTDDYVDRLIHRAAEADEPVMRALARCIETRRPPKLLKEVQVLEDTKHQEHNPGQFFLSRAKRSLKALAHRHGIPMGQFLLCSTRPLRLEPRGSFLTTEQARSVEPEQEDELIKVFVGNDAEPRSLVEVTHSIIHVCCNYSWQAFRLYLVHDGPDRSAIAERLRKAVRNWDKS